MTPQSEKQLLLIRKAHSLIFLIQVCLDYGSEETVDSFFKSMTQCWLNIPKEKRIELYRGCSKHCGFLSSSMEAGNL